MDTISYDELFKKAKSFKLDGTPWHHHFLTPNCALNKTQKFCIILENEDTSEVFSAEFDEKPLDKLKNLENLFFNRS